MKRFFEKNKYNSIFILSGGVVGFLYWYFIGCQAGTCPITSVWYNNTIYGAILGYLVGSLIMDFTKTKKKTDNISS